MTHTIRYAVFAVLLSVVVGCGATKTTPAGAPAAPKPTSESQEIEVDVFRSVNAKREAEGVALLEWNGHLAVLAREHSDMMAVGRVPLGHSGFDVRMRGALSLSGSKRGAENVSAQPRDATEVAPASVTRWLGSEKHRKNMLGPYTQTGVGVARAPDGKYFVTQIFVQ